MDDVNTKYTEMAKKAGRPPGRTQDRALHMRVDDAFIAQIDEWRKQQPGELLTRTEAFRRLTALALEVEAKKKGGKK